MLESVGNIPKIGLKGQNLHLIQINCDHWDVSTRESPSGESSKCENIINIKNNYKKVVKQNKKINNKILNNDTILNKKTKRGKNNQKIKDNKHYTKHYGDHNKCPLCQSMEMKAKFSENKIGIYRRHSRAEIEDSKICTNYSSFKTNFCFFDVSFAISPCILIIKLLLCDFDKSSFLDILSTGSCNIS